jgi:hypothetical protein
MMRSLEDQAMERFGRILDVIEGHAEILSKTGDKVLKNGDPNDGKDKGHGKK